MIDLSIERSYLLLLYINFDIIPTMKLKEEIETLQKSNDSLAKKVGNLTIEKDFLEGKLVSLVSSKERKALIDTGHTFSLISNVNC